MLIITTIDKYLIFVITKNKNTCSIRKGVNYFTRGKRSLKALLSYKFFPGFGEKLLTVCPVDHMFGKISKVNNFNCNHL